MLAVLTPADRQRLAVDYEPFARRQARPKAWAYEREHDDLVAIALLALAEAAAEFDPARGLLFPTFAALRIGWALSDAIHDMIPRGYRRRGVPGSDPSEAPARVPFRRDHAGQEPPACEAVDRADEIESWLRKIPARKAEVVRALYLEGQSVDEVGARFHLKRSSVFKLRKSALESLNDVAAFEAKKRDHPQ